MGPIILLVFYAVDRITDNCPNAEYNIRTNPNYPVVNVGSREKPSYLPAEVCKVIPGQPAKTKLNSLQTANMIKFAVKSPGENADSIVVKGAPLLGFSPTNSILVSSRYLQLMLRYWRS